ncbi:uncharacterized protein BT62DRAFT_938975 [Guyanagaster necrorhizus]|uniref:Uncharacterized protein n=1 Tax=Guyanagaster necrorhizus TaxID=856835 RepID=A0A9P7VF75_9AGAR|nr:uncharacterized protein BT62DRAFT_938975 [Guyanagaster necrorhizus MCA 3950]KAG7439472.1 hypothetical protein BT62DRAFT_938975 [Guyanagaster necrorhizus MCA 3950]
MIFCLIILAAIIVKGTIPFVIVYSDYAYCIFHTSTMDLLPIHRNLSSYSCFKNI